MIITKTSTTLLTLTSANEPTRGSAPDVMDRTKMKQYADLRSRDQYVGRRCCENDVSV